MNQPGIEPWSPGPLTNTQLIMLMAWLSFLFEHYLSKFFRRSVIIFIFLSIQTIAFIFIIIISSIIQPMSTLAFFRCFLWDSRADTEL